MSLRRQQFSKIPSPTLQEAASNATRSTTRPALGQLRRTNEPPPAPLNAILLEKVFGHDAASLQALLQRAIAVPFTLRWIGDEDVIVSANDTARLLSCVAGVKLLARAEHCASHVVAVSLDSVTKRILRRDDGSAKPAAQSLSRGTSSSGTTTPTSRPGGWAAVASGAAAAAAPAPARPSAWGAPARTQTALRPPNASAASVVHIPAVPAPAIPDDWQED